MLYNNTVATPPPLRGHKDNPAPLPLYLGKKSFSRIHQTLSSGPIGTVCVTHSHVEVKTDALLLPPPLAFSSMRTPVESHDLFKLYRPGTFDDTRNKTKLGPALCLHQKILDLHQKRWK